MKKYSNQFYEQQSSGSLRSAEVILSKVFQMLSPVSCVDYGCGVGAWLSVCKKLGAKTVIGYDGAYVATDQLLIEKTEFREVDLENVANTNDKFELAISVEVAEHLNKKSAKNFVATITSSADFILFSAAIPGQGGVRHINEQWQSYWVAMFRDEGFVPTTFVKVNFWNNEEIEFWYRQNCILFVKNSKFSDRTELNVHNLQEDFGPFDIVHPKQHEYNQNLGILETFKRAVRSYKY